MKTQERSDGSLLIHESWQLMRSACVVGGGLLPAVMLFAASGHDAINYSRIIGAFFGTAVLWLVAASVTDRQLLFDAGAKTLTWTTRNWFRTRSERLAFSDIRDVIVTQRRTRDDDTNRGYLEYSAALVTAAGQKPLTSTYGRNKQEYEKLVATVMRILSQSARIDGGDTDVRRLIAAGQMIDAVSLIRAQKGIGLTEAKALAEKIGRGLKP